MSQPRRPVAIVAGVPEELAGVRRALAGAREIAFGSRRAWRGRFGGRDVVLAVAGDGAPRARRVLDDLLTAVPCEAVVGLGVAGGLSRDLAVGALVAATEVRDGGGAVGAPDSAFVRAAVAAGASEAIALSTPGLAATPDEKAALLATCGGLRAIVDLESAAWAREAAVRALPFGILRVVSDAWDEELPDFILRSVRGDGSVDRGRVAVRAIVVPSRVPALLRLSRRVREASALLARSLGGIMSDAGFGASRAASREAVSS
jgi:adenosylhomocysteine nucleosidase